MVNHNEKKSHFQFTLGPVQGFVAQARRTRDFWAGSFILSWLSSVAIIAVRSQGGEIKFPIPDGTYMKWLTGEYKDENQSKHQTNKPAQGSIPNRFKAISAEVPIDFDGKLVVEAVKKAWEALANSVWEGDLAFTDKISSKTKEIWQRQVDNFWEMSWVKSEEGESNLLDRRKNWRTDVQSNEPGHKCMMMTGWQELSGISETNLTKVNQFWDRLRENNASFAYDLRQGERLCAMALIKRRFSRYFSTIEFKVANRQPIYGWELPSTVPSVSFLAASPWLAQAIRTLPVELFRDFHQMAKRLLEGEYNEISHVLPGRSNFKIDIQSVSKAVEQRQKEGFERLWAGLDGTVFFDTELDNIRNFSDPNSLTENRTKKYMRETQEKLKALINGMSSNTAQVKPSPYYAILLMDGDQLGKHMTQEIKQNVISEALNNFTNQVAKTVYAHNGFLVYAGGDDVLALFSMDDVFQAAAVLQQDYLDAFKKANDKFLEKNEKSAGEFDKVDSTLSGAIEFVHIRRPLTSVLKDAHNLLDEIAKEKIGRNALAVRVWKPSGLVCEWAMPWEKALDENKNVRIEVLANKFRSIDQVDFSNKFFFRAQQVVERLGNSLSTDELNKVLLSEWRHSFGDDKKEVDDAQFKELISQSWHYYRSQPGEPAIQDRTFNADTALLVRFLAQRGLGRNDQ